MSHELVPPARSAPGVPVPADEAPTGSTGPAGGVVDNAPARKSGSGDPLLATVSGTASMAGSPWIRSPRTVPRSSLRVLGSWRPMRAADVTAARRQLGAALHDGARPQGAFEEGVERLLLAFEELVSNAVRHGRPPVQVMVTDTGQCWLLEVADAAGGAPPTPDPGRDAALGGLGLALVDEISGARGWEPLEGGRKMVWACVDYTGEEAPPSLS